MDEWQSDLPSPRDDQVGGLAAATRFPLEPGMALDVYFQKPATGAGTYQPGFYRGIVDKVIKPPTAKTKAQTVEVDFPGDLTSAEIKVTEKSLLPPSTDRETVPAEPPKGADAVAIEVTEEEVAPDAVPKTPFGLTAEQKEAIDELYLRMVTLWARQSCGTCSAERPRQHRELSRGSE